MIVHLFNSSSVSGPERLVLPALTRFREKFMVVNLREDRIDHLRVSDPLEEFSRSLNLRFANVRVKGRWDRGAIHKLQYLLNELKPDLVHAHAMKASVYLIQATRKQRERGSPMVSTHHGVHGLPDWKTRLYEWIYRKRYLISFDRVLCVSSADYSDLLRSGISKDRLRLHLNGIDGHLVALEQRTKEAQKIRALWLPQESGRDGLFLFGMVGRLSREKDHARLLQVLYSLNHLNCERDWRCLIFGSGALENKLRQQTRELGLEQRVLWMGYRNDVGNELAGLDLLLSFSKAEGLPINLIESGWAGTPVMSTCVGGVTDLIPDESYGSRVPPDEPASVTAGRIQTFLSKEVTAKLQAQGARFQQRITKEFTQQRWIQRLDEIYSELKADFRASESHTIDRVPERLSQGEK
jgi:glycosyltransferase involved in cell wall biosynthesis